MYDALLDELEDDRTPSAEEAVDLVEKTADVEDDDDAPEDVACVALDTDDEAEAKTDDDLVAISDDDESWSDDPVRMYLTQMGEIPLLTRQQEVALAKQIEITRARFRRKVLECDYVMQTAVKVLRRVHEGELPFDRTVQVSVTDQLGEGPDSRPAAAQSDDAGNAAEAEPPRLHDRHQQVAPHERAPGGLAAAGPPPPPGRAAGRGAGSAHAADRADDQDARGVQPPRRRAEGRRSTTHRKAKAAAEERRALDRRVPQHPAGHAGNAHQPAQPRGLSEDRSTPSTRRPSAACRKATCGWSSRSPRSTATAA